MFLAYAQFFSNAQIHQPALKDTSRTKVREAVQPITFNYITTVNKMLALVYEVPVQIVPTSELDIMRATKHRSKSEVNTLIWNVSSEA